MHQGTLAGFLGNDAEERFTASGKRVVSFRLAIRIRQSGKDDTVWWRVNIWGDRFDKMIPYLRKGSSVIVVGEMGKPELYTDKEGNKQISLSISADAIKFAPSSKSPDKPADKSEGFGRAMPPQEEFATAGMLSGTSEMGFGSTGDDLPF